MSIWDIKLNRDIKELDNNKEVDILIIGGGITGLTSAYYLKDKVNILFGTHTHVQTSDSRILPNGTAYITDVGMTGPLDGVIGVEKSIIIDRYVNGGRHRFDPQETGKTQFSAVIIEINETTKIYGNDSVINTINQMCNLLLPERFIKMIGDKILLIEVKDGDIVQILNKKITFFDINAAKVKQFGFYINFGIFQGLF